MEATLSSTMGRKRVKGGGVGEPFVNLSSYRKERKADGQPQNS